MPYSIVHFFGDNSIETVPEHWIDKKNGTCAWPNKSKTASRLIEKKCMPNQIEYTYLRCRELCKGIDSLVEAKTKSKKALYMSDLSSTEETVSANERHKEIIISSPTLSTNSCPLFSDSDNDLASKKSSTKPKFSTTMIGSDNNEHFSSCSPLPKLLNDYPHEAIIDDSEYKQRYNKEPNYSPPVTSESLKTIDYNKTKKQNGWSPLKLSSPDKNVKDNNKKPHLKKQWSSKDTPSTSTFKSYSGREYSHSEPFLSKRNVKFLDSGNSEPIFKRKPSSTYTPTANLDSLSSKKQLGPYSKINDNEHSVVRGLMLNSNSPDEYELSFSHSNSLGKKKSYYIEQDGPNCGVVVTEKHFSHGEPLLATRKVKYSDNSDPLFKRKSPATCTPTANLNTFSSKQKNSSPYSKINDNKNSVVRELFSSSNKPEDDEPSFSHTNCFGKKKSYHVKQDDGPTGGVIAEVTPQRYSNDFQKQVLRMLTYLTSEVRYLESGQSEILRKIENAASDNNFSNSETLSESLFKDLTDCPLPIDNIFDLNKLEDKLSEDKCFRNKLVNELSCTGGKNLKLMVKRIMNKLFTDKLMSQYSFTGKKGKNKFNSLFVCAVIFDSIKKSNKSCKTASVDEIEERIKYNLAQAPFNKKNVSQN
ncbi:unnamed protein product [Macrosiphum euphorbiae]|uniref:DUF4806 domain-containing protein n=1 Tax=Macrosiphum euphorbiae TaxID=13131 RepID=A0AAV0XRA5_9HEMI|nr:unnamed protein product [Macrosiphum euphorbiae]